MTTPTPKPNAAANQPIDSTKQLLDWAEAIICNGKPLSHCKQTEWDEIVKNWRDRKHALFPDGQPVPQSSAAETARRLAEQIAPFDVASEGEPDIGVDEMQSRYDHNEAGIEEQQRVAAILLPVLTAHEEQVARLTRDAERSHSDHEKACQLVARMHAAAVGGVCAPIAGVVEDVAALRARLTAAEDALRVAREDGALLQAINLNQWGVFFNDRADHFIVQKRDQTVGNIGRGRTVQEAVADAQRRGEQG